MYTVIKSFRGSPDGCRVLEYETGQLLPPGTDFPPDLAEVALAEGWVTKNDAAPAKAPAKAKAKAKAAKGKK